MKAKRKLDAYTLRLLALPNPNGWSVLPADVDLRDPRSLDRFMPPPEILEQANPPTKRGRNRKA